MDCPLKYSLFLNSDSSLNYPLDARTIISTALAETYIKACERIAQGRPYSLAERAKFFSRVWNELKSKYISSGGDEGRTHGLLMTAHKKVLEMDNLIPGNWDVGVSRYPTELFIGDAVIKDRLDLVMVNRRKTNQVRIIIMDTSLCKESDIDYGIHLRALFNATFFKRELRSTPDMSIDCSVYNLHHGYQKPLHFTKNDSLNYQRSIKNVIKCINGSAFYPRASADSCKHCMFKNNCSFSIV